MLKIFDEKDDDSEDGKELDVEENSTLKKAEGQKKPSSTLKKEINFRCLAKKKKKTDG